MKQKATAFILSLCLLLSLIPLAAMPANAEGEIPLDAGVLPASGATYTISTAEQLKRLSDIVSGGNECLGATFVLTADIVLNDGIFTADETGEPLYDGEPVSATNQPEQWVPIGNSSAQFAGVFDGNGHTVSGLFFDNLLQDRVGLFDRINSGAQIKNVGVINSYLRGNNDVGGVCVTNNGTITSCYNTGIVSGRDGIGGVCGTNDGTITNCYNTGSVSGKNSVGGMCGTNNGTITNCCNTGSVSGIYGNVGGVCGKSDGGKVTSCYNTGSVSGNNDAGGVCGENDGGAITSCYNTGIVRGSNGVGGVCGYNNTLGTITNSYYLDGTASGGINGKDAAGKAEKKTSDKMKAADFVAAINGGGSAFIPSFNGLNGGYPMLKALCEFTGEGTAESPYLIYNANQLNYMSYLVNFDNTNYGNKEYKLMADIMLNGKKLSADNSGEPLYDDKAVSAENQPEKWVPIGLFTGTINRYFKGVFNGNGHTVSGLFFDNTEQRCAGLFGQINSGAQIKNVGVINSYIRCNGYVGGVCGDISNGIIKSCYNTGIVRGIGYFVGGVCGNNDGTITSCYNTGSVSGDDSVGGVCGYNSRAITSCYNTGIVRGGISVGGVCGQNNSGTITSCYYLDSCGAAGFGTSKAENEFNSGEVCYLLNSEKTDGTQAFYQNLGTGADKYPALDNTHGTVYWGYDRCFISYSNTELSETPSEHTYTVFKENGDGTHTRACTVCDETAEGHFDTADCTAAEDAAVAATCYSTGLTAGSHCPVCGYVITAQEDTQKIAHTYGEWESNNNGTHTKVCTVCDETADDHSVTDTCSFGEWSTVTASTCTAKGSESHACVGCGFSEMRETDLAEHEWETYFTIDEEATCANPGSKSIHCKNCPEKSNITEITKAEHSYGAWVSDGSGTHTRACSVCDETVDGHFDTASCVLTATVTPPTCTAGGCTTHACADCGYSYTDTETAATEHSFGSWHFEGGGIVRTCENCGTNESLFTVVWLSFVRIFNAAWLGLVNVFNKLWNVIPK